MKNRYFSLLTLIFLLMPAILLAENTIKLHAPIPLQLSDGSTKIFAKAIVSVTHPNIESSTKNFKAVDDNKITIDGKTFSVGDFVLTPGDVRKYNHEEAGFGAKILNIGGTELVQDDLTKIYIGDVRNDPVALVPPVAFLDGLSPYSPVESLLPGDAQLNSIAKVPGTNEDLALISYGPITYMEDGTGTRLTFSSPIFYIKRVIADGPDKNLYRLGGVLVKPKESLIENKSAIDIESGYLIGNDTIPDLAVLNQSLLKNEQQVYVTFFKGLANEWGNIEDGYEWAKVAYPVGKNAYDMAIASDLVNGEWRDSMVVPSFKAEEGIYYIHKFTNEAGNGRMVAHPPIQIQTPGLCKADEDCGPVQIKCADLNKDGCADCVMTWGKLTKDIDNSYYFELFNKFSVYLNKSAENGICGDEYETLVFDAPQVPQPAEGVGGNVLSPRQAGLYAIEIAQTDPEYDDVLDIWIGDQYFQPDGNAYVYLFRGFINSATKRWGIINFVDDVHQWKANYTPKNFQMFADVPIEFDGGISAITSDPFGNIATIISRPFVSLPTVPPLVCPVQQGMACEIGGGTYDSHEAPPLNVWPSFNKDNDCVPDCVQIRAAGPKGNLDILASCDREVNGVVPICGCTDGLKDCSAGNNNYRIEADGFVYDNAIDEDHDCQPDCVVDKDTGAPTACDDRNDITGGTFESKCALQCKFEGQKPCDQQLAPGKSYTFVDSQKMIDNIKNSTNSDCEAYCCVSNNDKLTGDICNKINDRANGLKNPTCCAEGNHQCPHMERHYSIQADSFTSPFGNNDRDGDCIPDCVFPNDKPVPCDNVLDCEDFMKADPNCSDFRSHLNREDSVPDCSDPEKYSPRPQAFLENSIYKLGTIVSEIFVGPASAQVIQLPGGMQNMAMDRIGGGGKKAVKAVPESEATVLINEPIIRKKGTPVDVPTPPEPKPGSSKLSFPVCELNVDRGELANDEYKQFRLNVRKLNDEVRKITGLPIDLFAGEYASHYEIKMCIPIAEGYVTTTDPALKATSPIVVPLYQTSGMQIRNYQAEAMRPVLKQALVDKRTLLVPTAQNQKDLGIKGLADVNVLPDNSVQSPTNSEYIINSVMKIVYGNPSQGSLVREIPNTDMAVIAPYSVSIIGLVGVDACPWPNESSCPEAPPPPEERGLNVDTILKGLKEGKSVSDLKSTWDKTGFLVQEYTTLPPGVIEDKSIAVKAKAVMDQAEANGLPIFTPDEQKLIEASVAHTGEYGYNATLFIVPFGGEARSGACSCDITKKFPNRADVVGIIIFLAFVGSLVLRRRLLK